MDAVAEASGFNHGVDVSTVVGELCEWVFSDFESKLEFDVWLDGAYPP